jgi:hypothetical protein
MEPADLYSLLQTSRAEEIRDLVKQESFERLIFRFSKNEIDKAIAIQLNLQEKAKSKFPTIFQYNPHWLIPSQQSIEQATSDLLALHKVECFPANSVVDLTGGMGVDVWAYAHSGCEIVYVERNPLLVDYARWNFQHYPNAKIVLTEAEEYISQIPASIDRIYLDPDRRVDAKRSFLLEESSPNVLRIWNELRKENRSLHVKLSPMMDMHYLFQVFPELPDIHVLSLHRDVKEVIVSFPGTGKITAEHFSNNQLRSLFSSSMDELEAPASIAKIGKFLYEPYPAMMKAACWGTLARDFEVWQLDTHAHLFSSDKLVIDFPGKKWEVCSVGKPGDRSLIDSNGMHIISRNFPLPADVIRKKYRIKEGQKLLLATTNVGKKVWITALRMDESNVE